MAKARTYECPGTERHPPHQFTYLHHPSDEPPPRYCPTCGWDSFEEDFPKAITSPHVQNATVVKAVDYEYRAMEADAEQRIAAAAEMSGTDAIDFGDMKITDLKDNLREGDIAAVAPAPNPVSQAVAAAPNIWGFQGAAAPQGGIASMPTPTEYAANSRVGPHPYAGLKTNQNYKKMIIPNAGDQPSLEVTQRDAMLANLGPGRRAGRR